MWGRLIPAGLLVLLGACGDAPGTPQALKESEKTSHCYQRGADSLFIRLDLMGDLVNGTFQGYSSDSARVRGTLTGAVEDGVVVVLLTYTGETGERHRQEVLLRREADGLRIGQGEMVDAEGYILFRDRNQVHYGPVVPEVACP